MKNGTELFAVGDTCNEIIGEASNWEEARTSIWDLKYGDDFWYVASDGTVGKSTWTDSKYDNRKLSIGTIGLTEEEAEEISWRMYFETNMRKEFKPEECNWKDSDEYKFFIMYNHHYKRFVVECNQLTQYQGTFYCNDREVVERFVGDNMVELRRYYGVK